MSNHNQSAFTPTELWVPNDLSTELDEPIQRALYAMNQREPSQLIDTLKRQVQRSEGGVALAMLRGENPKEYSDSEALVLFNPFANTATPNMLVRAEFIRNVAQNYDVRAVDGKFKPVIMLASPGFGGSKLRLSKEERSELRYGELGPAARELLRAVSEQDFGRVALLGFSQGADMALAGARSAYSAHLDTHAVAVGDPAGVEIRSMPQLAGDFFKAGAGDLKRAVTATGLEAQKKALGAGLVDFSRFGISASRPSNVVLYQGLGNDVFSKRVQTILDERIVKKLVVGYGGNSAIAKPESIEPAIDQLYERNGKDSFMTVKVHEGNHAWGDQLTILAKLYMRALS